MNDENSCAHVREALGHQIHVLATRHLQQSLVPIRQLSFAVSFAVLYAVFFAVLFAVIKEEVSKDLR
jgi:hypothetical protein